MLLFLVEYIVYWALLARLRKTIRTIRPDLADTLGRSHPEDFLLIGFVTGNSLISAIEGHRKEFQDNPEVIALVGRARATWYAQVITVTVAFVVFVAL